MWPLSTCDILHSCLDAQGLAVSASGSGPWASVAPCSQAGHPCASAPPPPALGSSRSVLLDHHPIRNGGILGFDHGAGHPLLFLDDAKAPNYRKNNGFKG